MKPFVVLRMDMDKMFDMVPGRDGDLRFVCWGQKEEESKSPQTFDGSHPVYFADTEADANTLAGHLASKKPGTYWVVAKSASSFRSTPGPVAKAAFTEHGMLPVL
jgi:hypothetical protein